MIFPHRVHALWGNFAGTGVPDGPKKKNPAAQSTAGFLIFITAAGLPLQPDPAA